ncbi:MAG TPA: flagellar hook-associated protein 2 [Bacillota bacterium]|nr:flagellar hook-associated protein 2 [Bacillota bacterium]
MRIGGLATGIDVDQLVDKLMEAERIPLNKMHQDQTLLTWKRDAFRDINKSLLELDQMILDMKLSKTYNAKEVTSSNENAVTATASSSTPNGTYDIEVEQLATSAINVSGELSFDPNAKLADVLNQGEIEFNKEYAFYTYDEDGEKQTHTFSISEDDTLNDVLKRITKDDNNVRAFYDPQTNKVIMEATRTGHYPPKEADGAEIDVAGNPFFTDVLNFDVSKEIAGTDAKFKYNGIEMTSKTNTYELNGVTFQLNGEGTAHLTVANDVDASFDKMMEFIDKYNEVVDKLNESQQEEKYRDYPPLTEEQKKEMSEREIELWEEKAKSGILRGESILSNGLYAMRNAWYSTVETGDEYTSLTQIGLTTSENYLDGGKLVFQDGGEAKLKEALRENPESVYKLFSNSDEGSARGLINRLEDAVESTMQQIERRAGKSTDTLENYTLGRRMKDLNDRISTFEERLIQVETRYWNQFTAMETAVQRMNEQSMFLLEQFGDGM